MYSTEEHNVLFYIIKDGKIQKNDMGFVMLCPKKKSHVYTDTKKGVKGSSLLSCEQYLEINSKSFFSILQI